MKCHLCNGEDFLFKCNYCKEFFCTEHRLPISHSCSAIDRFSEKRKINLFRDNSPQIVFLIILVKLSIFDSLEQK
jgi:predicted nucleic acid binding AN1-type Zn finger protein